MSWRNRPMAGFDTETTGVNPEADRIVTACVGIGTQQGWSARNWLIKQAQPIPEQATEVHGITTEHANAEGIDPSRALAEIRDDLYKAWEMGMPVCGFNIVYDLTILDRNLRAHSLGGLEIRGPVIDPLVLDKSIDRFRRGSRKLIDVCAHYGIVLTADDAHGAEPDARAAARLAWRLGDYPAPESLEGSLEVAKELPDLPAFIKHVRLDALTRWQSTAYADQRRSFADYLARQGKQLDDPSTDWPLRPYRQEVAA